MKMRRTKLLSGLSPPTRGSPLAAAGGFAYYGSIPAHAGKPVQVGRAGLPAAVYPRPRGEAPVIFAGEVAVSGLSPPTRGSRVDADISSVTDGSIPAHAGKPLAFRV